MAKGQAEVRGIHAIEICQNCNSSWTEDRSQKQNSNPKSRDGSRDVSTKRKNKTQDGQRNQEVQSLGSNGTNPNGSNSLRRSTDGLASSARSLQRLADLAHYFGSSFLDDIEDVEETHGKAIERENEIRRLQEALETLTYIKGEEMENLKQENQSLRSNEEACKNERAKCKTFQADLEAQNAEGERRRNEEYARKVQEQKQKTQKHIDAKRAEIEAESKQRLQETENKAARLAQAKKGLEARVLTAEENLEREKSRLTRLEQSYEGDIKRLTSEVEELKSEIPIESKSVDHFTERFQQIHGNIRKISAKYFQNLPERAVNNPESIQRELYELDPIFESTPIWQTEVSEFIRMRNAQHIITSYLCKTMWQPFHLQYDSSVDQQISKFLEAASISLSASSNRCESIWRVLTLRAIESFPGSSPESSQADLTVSRILLILRPLIEPSQIMDLEKDLLDIVESSAKLWHVARKNEANLVIESDPSLEEEHKWHAEDCAEIASLPKQNMDVTPFKPLCLFPAILHITPQGVNVAGRGSALFPSSKVWIQGLMEKEEHKEELRKAVLDATSKVSARRASLPTGPKSPTKG